MAKLNRGLGWLWLIAGCERNAGVTKYKWLAGVWRRNGGAVSIVGWRKRNQ